MLPQAAIITAPGVEPRIYTPAVRRELDALCRVVVDQCSADELARRAAELADVRFLFSSWGPPRLNAPTLALFPKLEAVFYGAGSVSMLVTEEFWAKNIPLCSAWAVNAIPTAEYSFAQIVLGLKQVHRLPGLQRAARKRAYSDRYDENCGAFGTTVGIVSLGQIGRRVVRFLRQLDVHIVAYDPFVTAADAAELGVTLVSLPEVFARSRVVSLHAPWIAETEGMITGKHLAALPFNATFINAARGALVREDEMIGVLRRRPDLTAVLDVTWPEPPVADSPLYDLPNVFLTPHIAGSQGPECARMGLAMVEECHRFLAGQPLQRRVTRELAARMT